jgi:pancreatic triacylglycerol lipase
MTKELLKLSDCSVIVIDWSGGSGPPYPQAVANIRLVGTMTAHLINHIVVSMPMYYSNILCVFSKESQAHFIYSFFIF